MITEEEIWNYLDGSLSVTESAQVKQAIESNEQTLQLFTEISSMHSSLKEKALLSPSPSFINHVMVSVQTTANYTAVKGISVKTMFLFAMPTIILLFVFTGLLVRHHIHLTLNLPAIDFSHFKLIFILADVLLLAYVIDLFPEKQGQVAY